MNFIVKNTTFPNLLDLIAPHSCRGCGRLGTVLCDCCKKNITNAQTNLCPICKKPTTNGKCKKHQNLPPVYIAGSRANLLNNLIHDFKYHSVRALAQPLAQILDSILPKISTPVVIVPLPTISKHIRTRGLDHTLHIAKHLARIRGKHYRVQKLLLRAKDTIQVGADRQARLSQAASAYVVNPKITINPNATYILLDDVWTTGASMLAATKKLQQAGAKHVIISIIALSRL